MKWEHFHVLGLGLRWILINFRYLTTSTWQLPSMNWPELCMPQPDLTMAFDGNEVWPFMQACCPSGLTDNDLSPNQGLILSTQPEVVPSSSAFKPPSMLFHSRFGLSHNQTLVETSEQLRRTRWIRQCHKLLKTRYIRNEFIVSQVASVSQRLSDPRSRCPR